jgi:hypothetical protein
MRGRIYTCPIATPTAQTAATDAFEVTAAATGIVALRRVHLFQTSDAGDAEEEVLEVVINRVVGAFTSGSGGETITPAPVDQEVTAASTVVEARNTTVISGGSATQMLSLGWNVRSEFLWIPAEGEEIICHPTDAIVVNVSAPADSLTYGGSVVIEELGT